MYSDTSNNMIPTDMTLAGQSQILTEDPDGHQSENQQYIETQDPQEHTVFTQQHGQHFNSHKQNQLFISTQQTASSLDLVLPSENALTPNVPSVRQSAQQPKLNDTL